MDFIRFLFLLVLFHFSPHLKGQDKCIERVNDDVPVNIVKKIVFVSEGQHYPLTVLFSRFGYWDYCIIRHGFSDYSDFDYLKSNHFGWTTDGVGYKTPYTYVYDTLKIDTLYSIFNTVMCESGKSFTNKNEPEDGFKNLDDQITIEFK